MTQYNNSLTEGLGVAETNTHIQSFYLTDALGIDEVLTPQQVHNLIDQMGIHESIDTLITAYESLSEGVGIDEAFNFTIDLIATDEIGLNESLSVYKAYAALLSDALVIADIADTQLTAQNLLTAIIGIAETLDRALDATILDQLGLTESTLSLVGLLSQALDTLGINDTITLNVGLYIEVSDNLGLSDAILTGNNLQAIIEEGLLVSTTLLGPGTAVYRGWTMNSENFAVTTYSNFGFNSFAKINGQYFGMKEDGFCLLDGATDNGAYVQSVLRTAKMDLGTSNIKTMTQFYIGFRGDGNPVLKVITDDASETWYDVTEQDTELHTDRVSLAKGTAGRYWQLELVTTDSTKAEYDTIELFPMVWGRKV